MGDIAKGALGGAWSLLVGWVLPTALNLAVLTTALLPSLRGVPPFEHAADLASGRGALAFLTASLMLGLVLNALQNPLYRILEGYLLWPSFAYEYGCRRHQAIRQCLTDRLLLMRLERRATDGSLPPVDMADLALLRHSPRLARYRDVDRRSTVTRRALLQELLARYPVDEGHLAPTRLGNAIRRFEIYAYDRYQLDSQLLWNELTATAPEQARRQVDTARTSVDFFVCLLYGHIAYCSPQQQHSPRLPPTPRSSQRPQLSSPPSSLCGTAAPLVLRMNGPPQSVPWLTSADTLSLRHSVWTSRRNSPPSARCGPWCPAFLASRTTKTQQLSTNTVVHRKITPSATRHEL